METLTTNEVAERLGIHITRVHQLIKDDRLPAKKKGRDWFVNESDLALVADRKPGRPPKLKNESEPATSAATDAAAVAAEPLTPQVKAKRTAKQATAVKAAKKAKPSKKGKAE